MLEHPGLHYLDTNIFTYALEFLPNIGERAQRLLQRIESGSGQTATSSLTLSELLVQPMRTGNRELIKTYTMLFAVPGVIHELTLTRSVMIKAAELRAAYAIKLPDAIHAAAALENNCVTFVTADKRFTQIDGLNVHLLA